MSNRNHQNPNHANNQGENNAPANGGEKKEKLGFFGRIVKIKDKVMANKFGRFAVRGLGVLGVGTGMYLSYKAGTKSVKPTVVYVKEGVTEEEPETVEPETKEEPAENDEQE